MEPGMGHLSTILEPHSEGTSGQCERGTVRVRKPEGGQWREGFSGEDRSPFADLLLRLGCEPSRQSCHTRPAAPVP
jgi:hypothetical protein